MFGQPLQNKWNVQYVGYVSLGEPAQRFRTIFDTGSFSLWVPRKGCTATGPKAENCANKTELYDSKKSKTAKELKGQVYNETYGTGGAVGATFTDVFAVRNTGTPIYIPVYILRCECLIGSNVRGGYIIRHLGKDDHGNFTSIFGPRKIVKL